MEGWDGMVESTGMGWDGMGWDVPSMEGWDGMDRICHIVYAYAHDSPV